jgi:serine/threonine-protein kinase
MPADKDQPPFKPNDVIDSKYRITKVLGEGGMSVVYDAVDITCDRVVAIKVIRPSAARRKAYSLAQIRREAQALVQIHEKTESVVEVLTAGIEQRHGLPFYVMERLRGSTLRQFIADQIRRRSEFTTDEIAAIGIPIALALAHAHQLGVVHRDIKPENVFMAQARDGGVGLKLLDFGICTPVPREGDEPSTVGFAGSLPYASPEQLEGERATGATDVYALGLVLFELLTLVLPHGRRSRELTPEDLALRIMADPVPNLAVLRRDTPPRLVSLVARSLAWDPSARPKAHDLAMGLRDVKAEFLGELVGGPVEGLTDPSGPPIEVLHAQIAAASTRVPHVAGPQVLAGQTPVGPGATTEPPSSRRPLVPGGESDDEVFFARSAPDDAGARPTATSESEPVPRAATSDRTIPDAQPPFIDVMSSGEGRSPSPRRLEATLPLPIASGLLGPEIVGVRVIAIGASEAAPEARESPARVADKSDRVYMDSERALRLVGLHVEPPVPVVPPIAPAHQRTTARLLAQPPSFNASLEGVAWRSDPGAAPPQRTPTRRRAILAVTVMALIGALAAASLYGAGSVGLRHGAGAPQPSGSVPWSASSMASARLSVSPPVTPATKASAAASVRSAEE